MYPPQGTYFVTADIGAWATATASSSAATLPDRAGVVAIPSAVFYDHQDAARTQVRFAFCKRPEVLTEALARLSRISPG